MNDGEWRRRRGEREGEDSGLETEPLGWAGWELKVSTEVGEVREGICHSISMPGNQETVMPITPFKNPLYYQETTSGIEREEATDVAGGGEGE